MRINQYALTLALLVSLLVAAAAATSALRAKDKEIDGLKAEVTALKDHVAVLKRNEERCAAAGQQASMSVPLGKEAEGEAAAPAPTRVGDRDVPSKAERSAQWRSRQFVSEVEEDLALTPEQKEALSEAYRAELGATIGATEQAREAVLERVLGAETAAVYRERRVQAEEKERSERLATEAIVLARKLSLTPEQEERAKSALARIEASLRPKSLQIQMVMREAMANHLGGDEAKEELKSQYDQIKSLSAEVKSETNKALFEELSPVLTDEQKNALLAYQAEQR